MFSGVSFPTARRLNHESVWVVGDPSSARQVGEASAACGLSRGLQVSGCEVVDGRPLSAGLGWSGPCRGEVEPSGDLEDSSRSTKEGSRWV
ncbi:hypothetical protein GUJ93_ZPchr0001g29323 [Zizania palustris]|uniref:Uncharacterized protein n=1 Tax=Zizania palustris TaxID=103762 RepID=A0A8J5RTL2_ZIZPA|nr:hypothetical protein GUJ93_ZPchr0001g29323 [Zizania palustris]